MKATIEDAIEALLREPRSDTSVLTRIARIAHRSHNEEAAIVNVRLLLTQLPEE